MNSCLYEGRLRHRRVAPVSNEFTYPVFYAYLDLAELDEVFRGRWLWSARRPAVAWFRRADFLGDARVPLEAAVRDRVEQTEGVRPSGPIRMLTNLRYFGYQMNPVSFYYCFDAATGSRPEWIVAEINNTPWNERHSYVLNASGWPLRFQFGKDFHVSPFMPMTQRYDWRFTVPGDTLSVHMENFEAGARIFDATLTLERQPISNRVLFAHPLMTAQVMLHIYWQAVRLWMKGAPFHAHPRS